MNTRTASPKGQDTKKKIKRVLIGAFFALLFFGALTLVRHRFPQTEYYVKDFFLQFRRGQLPQEETSLALAEKTYEELLADPRITFNQSLMLINTQYPLEADFAADLGEYKDSGVVMNNCVMEAYARISDSVRERFGETLYIRSAYRSAAEQQEQIDLQGDSIATAVGASEHQAGLGLDVYVPYFAGPAFLKTPAGRWVAFHCQDEGFILRYPVYGEKETGISFEPWHLRYVGFPHAKVIMENRLTLEEYIGFLKPGSFYRYEDYILSRQSPESIQIPEEFESAVVSPDNCGFLILTFQQK